MSDRSGRPAAVATSAGSSVTYGPKSSSKEEPKETSAQEKAEKAKSGRWEGIVTGSHKDKSTLIVRRRDGFERTIHYDSSTQWTSQEHHSQQINTIDASQVKNLGPGDLCGILRREG